jgi:hypothetical protein
MGCSRRVGRMGCSRHVGRMGYSRRVGRMGRAIAAAPRTSAHPHARLRSPRRSPSPCRPAPARAPPPPPTPAPAPRMPRRMPRGGWRVACRRTHSRRRHAVRRLGQSWGAPVGRGGGVVVGTCMQPRAELGRTCGEGGRRRGGHLHAASGRVGAYLWGGGRRGEHLHAASGRVGAYLEGVGSGKRRQRGRGMRGAVVCLEHSPHAYLIREWRASW